MINFLDVKNFSRKLKPVTSTELITKSGEFHPDGLFSESIFGPIETPDRKKTFSYIQLNCSVIHPSALKLLTQLDRKVEQFISAQENFSLDSKKRLQIDSDGVTGISEFIKLFPTINFRGETERRDKFIEKLKQSYKSGTLFINLVPVIPPEYRPAYQDDDGQWIVDNLNNYYLTIVRKSFHIKTAAKSGPLYDLLNYDMQKAVIDHDEYIRSVVQKKQGLIRSQLLGKRTEFSGRAVITPGPSLKVNEIGIPLRIAISIFEPFIIHRLLFSGMVDKEKLSKEVKDFTKMELNIDSIKRIFKAIKSDDRIPKSLYDIVFQETENVMIGRVVLAKRDPVLHPESIRAFKAKLVTGNTIQLSTMQVGGFGADFDGDTMAIFHPITNESQKEAMEKMLRSESAENMNSVNFAFEKEMGVGLYLLTKNIDTKESPISVSEEDLEKAVNPYIAVLYRSKKTTMGKAIFNSCFPPDFPFVSEQVTRGMANGFINKILSKYGQGVAIETFSKLKVYSFKFATLMAPSILLDNFKVPPEIKQLQKKLESASTEEAFAILDEMKVHVKKFLKDSGFEDLILSGSAKGWDQPMQILGAKGIFANPSGEIQPPVKSSFADGLTPKEYFSASMGARKGIIDRVLNTADTGYVSRQLAFVLNSVEIDRSLKDCKTNRVLSLRLTSDILKRISGRYIINTSGHPELINLSDFKGGETINLRSPVYCKSRKICHTCYGKLLERSRSPYAGILAAQVIGERATQLIMRTFHTGGAVTETKQDLLQDILDNDPLLKITKSDLSKYLSQSQNQLFTLKKCKLILNTTNYEKEDIRIDEQRIWVKNLVSTLEFDNLRLNLIFDYEANIEIFDELITDGTNLIIQYDPNSTILTASIETQQINQQIKYLTRLLRGGEIYKDVDHLFRKLLKIYLPISSMDLVHLEILLSQCLRDRKKPQNPARLGKEWDPIMMNIKQIVFNTSFVQGLAFENINEAIRVGLIQEEPEEPSILERVMTGEIIPKKG